jgi:hypothetical protein
MTFDFHWMVFEVYIFLLVFNQTQNISVEQMQVIFNRQINTTKKYVSFFEEL